MTVAWDLNYDRRVSPGFLDRFADGPLSLLVEIARYAPFPVDLQFRKNPKTNREHASLYVGLTDVLKIDVAANGYIRLRAHPTWSATASQPKAGDGGSAGVGDPANDPNWSDVEDYLERVLPAATAKHATQEGSVQAAVSGFEHGGIVMIDREAALHFRDNDTKKQIFEQITTPIIDALRGLAGVKGQPKEKFGGECDLLGVDDQGRLLTIEIKPRNVGSIRWAAAQATVYANLFARWLQLDPTRASPTDVLRDEWQQRANLGLARPMDSRLTNAASIRPTVVVQRGTRPALIDEFWIVQNRLCDAGVGYPDLKLSESGLTGKLRDIRADGHVVVSPDPSRPTVRTTRQGGTGTSDGFPTRR